MGNGAFPVANFEKTPLGKRRVVITVSVLVASRYRKTGNSFHEA